MSPLRRDQEAIGLLGRGHAGGARNRLDAENVRRIWEAGCDPIQIRIDEARRLGRLLRARRVDELKRVQLAVAHDKTDPDRFPG